MHRHSSIFGIGKTVSVILKPAKIMISSAIFNLWLKAEIWVSRPSVRWSGLAPTKVISRTSRVAGTLRTEYSSTPTRRSRRRVYQRLLDFAFGDFYIAQSVHFAKVFGFDGYNLDGFGTSALCYCRYCQDAYKKDSGKLLPASRDVASIEFRRFMRWKLNRWTDFVCRWQKAINGWDEIIFRPLSGGRFAHQ